MVAIIIVICPLSSLPSVPRMKIFFSMPSTGRGTCWGPTSSTLTDGTPLGQGWTAGHLWIVFPPGLSWLWCYGAALRSFRVTTFFFVEGPVAWRVPEDCCSPGFVLSAHSPLWAVASGKVLSYGDPWACSIHVYGAPGPGAVLVTGKEDE